MKTFTTILLTLWSIVILKYIPNYDIMAIIIYYYYTVLCAMLCYYNTTLLWRMYCLHIDTLCTYQTHINYCCLMFQPRVDIKRTSNILKQLKLLLLKLHVHARLIIMSVLFGLWLMLFFMCLHFTTHYF